MPDTNGPAFKELIIEKVGADVIELRDVLRCFVESDNALSIGEDFVLVFFAEFTPGTIEVTKQIGLNLALPMAAVLPSERHLRSAHADKLSRRVAAELVGNAEMIASAVGAVGRVVALLAGRRSKFAGAVGVALSRPSPKLEDVIKSAGARSRRPAGASPSRYRNATPHSQASTRAPQPANASVLRSPPASLTPRAAGTPQAA